MAIVDLRYARALEEVVAEQGLPRDEVKRQLEDFQATFAESAPLREVLGDPSIPQEGKSAGAGRHRAASRYERHGAKLCGRGHRA